MTDPSNPIENRGCDADKITCIKTTELALDSNDSGEYDLFLFYHNDITNAWLTNTHPASICYGNDPQRKYHYKLNSVYTDINPLLGGF